MHMVLESRDSEDAAASDAASGAASDAASDAASGAAPDVASGSDASRRRYELYADVDVAAYDRIRLSKTMLSDHFLPKYLEALEDVREGFARRDSARGRCAKRPNEATPE